MGEASFAQRSQGFCITQDLDFSDIRSFAPGTDHGLVLVRLRLPGRRALTRRITEVFAGEAREDVELICEVQSFKGTVRIERDSLRLVRLADQEQNR